MQDGRRNGPVRAGRQPLRGQGIGAQPQQIVRAGVGFGQRRCHSVCIDDDLDPGFWRRLRALDGARVRAQGVGACSTSRKVFKEPPE